MADAKGGGEFAALDSFLAGESGKHKGSSLLPAPVSPAWYNAETKTWYGEKDMVGLKKKEKEALVQCTLFVQYSPTGRARCRRCGDVIEKDKLRFGYPFRYRECEDPHTVFLHTECYEPEVFGIKEKELNSKIFGYKALNNTEKANVWKAMRSVKQTRTAASEGKAAAAEYANGSIGCSKALPPPPPVPIPKGIVVPMLPFQKEGLAWMCRQEEMNAQGGILADEMGMGKTIQAISLLLARPQKGPCLVVCPMAAVTQWVKEIERFTSKNALRTLVYHGVQKARLATEFRKTDVVLTTYQTLETDYRRETDKTKLACKYCQKLFLPEKLAFHQKYFCGPEAQRTAKQRKTDIKHQDAAKKAMETMGIGQKVGASSVYAPPTITNIYKDYMAQAGVDVKAKGYWNVVKEVRQRNAPSSSSSSSSKAASGDGDVLSRERLRILDRAELVDLCVKRGLDKTGKKPDLIDRLMDFSVRGNRGGAASSASSPAKATKSLGRALIAQAKAKAKACLKRPAAAAEVGKSSKAKAGAAKAAAPLPIRGGGARTVASEKAARAAAAAKGAKTADAKGAKGAKGAKAAAAAPGSKRKRAEMEKAGAGPAEDIEYQTYEGAQMDLSGSPLHAIQWSRIILDEAHRIKGRTNSTALAAYALQGGFKWCLTGTPLQNRVGELYSLIRFLRLRPYAFYYCKIKGCNCECARFMRDRYCPNCGHVRFCHYSHFKSKVSNPIIKYGYMGAGKDAFNTLRHEILNRSMLRRTKEERKADLKLPGIKVVIRKDALSNQELDFYTSLYKQSCVKFDTFIDSGTILHNYAHIFDLLTSLRRAVDHPYLIVYGGGQATHKLPNGKQLSLESKSNDVCALCQDDVLDDGEEPKRVAKCGHVFHDDCIRAYIADAPPRASGGVGCPACFAKLQVELEDKGGDSEAEADDDEGASKKKGRARSASAKPQRASSSSGSRASAATTSRSRSPAARAGKSSAPAMLALPAPGGKGSAKGGGAAKAPASSAGKRGAIMQKVKASEFQSSTKIEALLDEVQKMIRQDSTAKAIVFSQFGAMLELVEFRLKRAGISCVIFRGGMTMEARDAALAAFNTEPSLKVILISLKAGGEGLNLQVANHVFLLDPWWNPACELQAIQRAHRIGQTKEVKAVRFITKDTIEEKIIKLQEKKQLVFDASIDGSSAAVARLTEQDLRFLFQH
eukprot:TRINITY_DN25023_c0_g4_i1.p1 TRINITY_DN25023_c0_g4~~TRINITY_DN25023_c0_g4_i1.p1  ORF type:complete len:1193 (+),score=345.81 TRINITY_DN25023_c0_g4_i1:101-3679(+)